MRTRVHIAPDVWLHGVLDCLEYGSTLRVRTNDHGGQQNNRYLA